MNLIKKYKNDIFLVSALILTGAVLTLWMRGNTVPGKTAVVSVNSEEYGAYPLDKDITVEIPGYDGGSNTLVIKDGSAMISSADCPDRLCVRSPKIDSSGESIICLPHRVTVRIR